MTQEAIGQALETQKDSAGALAAYRQSVAIDESLPAGSESGTNLRAVESVSQEAIGRLLEAQKDLAGALAAMRAALALRQGLADATPIDPQPRRMQLVDQNGVGRLLFAQGDRPAALAAYQAGLAVARELAARPGADATDRTDLVITLFLTGAAGLPSGGAAADLAEGLPLAQALAAAAPTNAQYRNLVLLLGKTLGDARVAAGDNSAAVDAYVSARDAATALVATNPKDANAAAELKAIVAKIALAAQAMLFARDFQGALAALDEAAPVAAEQNWFDLIRAACLMFLGRADEARALYAKHRGETTYAGKSWEAATKDGFALLRAKGLDNPLMAEIEAQMAAAK
jgi:tetratricopeptide (TPR) repeat protein